MPHKRNPIKSEQVAGLARVLRGNASARPGERRAVARARHLALVGGADHPARTRRRCWTTCSAACWRWSKGMVVNAERMRENLELTHGALFSQRRAAGARGGRAAPATTPTASSSGWPSRRSRRAHPAADLLASDPAGDGLDLDAIFDYAPFVQHAAEIVGRLDAIA